MTTHQAENLIELEQHTANLDHINEAIAEAKELHVDIDGWLSPDMSALDAGRLTPPALDLAAFRSWGSWMHTVAQGVSAPPDYVALALLCATASLIGNSRVVQAWESWTEPFVLWGMLVGMPSSGKSPALHSTLRPLHDIDAELAKKYADEYATYKSELREAKEHRAKGEQVTYEPVLPKCRCLVLIDVTIEKLAVIGSENPKGGLVYRDELPGWLRNLGRYGPSDKFFFTQAFNALPYRVQRKGEEQSLHIPRLAFSLIGGIQPDALETLLLSGDDDGLCSRFLVSWPSPVPPRRPTVFPNMKFAEDAFRRLHGLDLVLTDKADKGPLKVKLTEEAAQLLDGWRRRLATLESASGGLYLSHLGKAHGLALRIAGVLEYLEWSVSDEDTPEPARVSAESQRLAIELLENYFLPSARRAYADSALPLNEKNASALAREIRRRGSTLINGRVIRKVWRIPGLRKSEAVTGALNSLIDAGWLARRGGRAGDRPGRGRDDYLVNKRVLGPSFNGSGNGTA